MLIKTDQRAFSRTAGSDNVDVGGDAELELSLTKPKDPQDLTKTGKHWSDEETARVNRIFQMVMLEGGPTFNGAIEKVLGRKPGEPTWAGTAPWRQLHHHIKTARNMAERNGVHVVRHCLAPGDFVPPAAAEESMITFARRLAARYLKSAPDPAVKPHSENLT